MPRIDLHIHTAHSDDGEFSVEETMELCRKAHIEYMSITDHNSVRGVEEALELSAQMGIRAVPGIELDCVHKGRNFHLLGYNFDYTNPTFSEIERYVFKQERTAAEQKIDLIKLATGIPLRADDVLEAARGRVVTGEMIAEILLKKENAAQFKALLPYLPGGARSDNPYVNFYWDFFSQGKPAYVPIDYISMNEAAALICATGGICVLAHPGQNLKGDYAFLRQIMEVDIDGIESYSSYHNSEDAAYFAGFAEKNNLLVTCGSDFHGKTKPSISLCGHGAVGDMSKLIEVIFA